MTLPDPQWAQLRPGDRTYWHVPGARSWHALTQLLTPGDGYTLTWHASCGRAFQATDGIVEQADRVPAAGHLCGSCARVIAARTDIETSGDGTRTHPAEAVDASPTVGQYEPDEGVA